MIEFRLPSLGSDMDHGTLLAWQVAPGDRVVRGQVVAVVDTAKAAIDIECWHDGVVHRLLAKPGAKLPVGSLMAVLRVVQPIRTLVQHLEIQGTTPSFTSMSEWERVVLAKLTRKWATH